MISPQERKRLDWRKTEDELRLPSVSFHISDDYLGSASIQVSDITVIALVSRPAFHSYQENGSKGQLAVIIPSQYGSAVSARSILQKSLEAVILLEALPATRTVLRILPLSLSGSELAWMHLAAVFALLDSGIPLRYVSTMMGVGVTDRQGEEPKIVLDPYSDEADSTVYVEATIDNINIEYKENSTAEADESRIAVDHKRSSMPKRLIRTTVDGAVSLRLLDVCIGKALSALEPLNRCILEYLS